MSIISECPPGKRPPEKHSMRPCGVSTANLLKFVRAVGM